MKSTCERFKLVALATVATLFIAIATASYAVEPCCNITSIDTITGIITAKVNANANGQTFQFRVNDVAQLKHLKVGQPIYANLNTRQVSFDGQHAAGELIGAGSPTDVRSSLTSPIGRKSEFRPYGAISAVQGLNATAVKQQGSANQPSSVQFQIPANQQGQTRPGQPVWMNVSGQQIQFVSFPIHLPDTKTRVGRGPGKGSFWVETSEALVSANGLISGVTKIQSEDYMAGFTGNVALRLLDSQGNDLAGWLKAGCWGVNLRSGRTETWNVKVDPTIAVNTQRVDLKQFDSPCGRDRWDAALAKAETVAEVAGKMIQAYTSATGSGGTGGTGGTTPTTSTTSPQ